MSVSAPTALDAVNATHSLLESALAAPRRDRETGLVSAPVARQMLHLLGDNEAWSTRPTTDQMAVWATIRNASPDELEVLAPLHPEQVEAYRHALKHWGLNWLRSIVEKSWAETGERLDAIAAETDPQTVAPCPECAAGKHRNCDGRSWDMEADAATVCPCSDAGH